jgi:hypothetical protein
MYGQVWFAHEDEGFADEREAELAWRANRVELMAEPFPARLRPWGHFKFDLGCNPRWWYEEITCLLERDLISREEAFSVERRFPMLAEEAKQCFSSFENPELIRSLWLQRGSKADSYVLKRVAAECDLASKWHAWRGRKEIAERFELRSATIQQIAQEENQWKV